MSSAAVVIGALRVKAYLDCAYLYKKKKKKKRTAMTDYCINLKYFEHSNIFVLPAYGNKL